jgi:cytidylate kinase
MVTAGQVRVAHVLSLVGFCSRRQGERLIQEGRVEVNGHRVETPATLIDPTGDVVTVDGNELRREAPRLLYLAVNKPPGVVSTVSDPHADRTVVQLVASLERLYPVGRLDKDSEGLIILTNDGSFANRVAHPRYETEREYLALVPERPSDQKLQTLRRGVTLEDGVALPGHVEVLRGIPDAVRRIHAPKGGIEQRAHGRPDTGSTWLRVVLREGRNREVRRLLQAVGYPVRRLVRTRIGSVRLGNLRSGAYRKLTASEVRSLVGDVRRARPAASDLQRRRGMQGARSMDARTEDEGASTNVRLVVAIDGPSGAGKTTVGKRLAQRLAAAFLDTGVLYRALTLSALETSVSPDDAEALARLALDLIVDVRASDGGADLVSLSGRDVTDAIRSPTVDAFVSQVSAHGGVRDALVATQRRIAESGRAVVAGRDIGTVIFPDAQVKVFLEASGSERARRRAEQSGSVASEVAVQHDMERRDTFDRDRIVAPMEPAPDAVIIETDDVPIEEVVERIYSLVPATLRAPHE